MAKPLTDRIGRAPGFPALREYAALGGYRGLDAALAMSDLDAVDLVKRSGLRGRGGAGFPTWQKWTLVPKDDPKLPRYLIVNADEKEPGTMKDRYLIEGDPHGLIEGIAIAAHAIKASAAFIYLRREYGACARAIEKALAEAKAAGRIKDSLPIHLHLGAGRYLCGEETGLLNAMEGRRGTPRTKPPFPQVSGLWGKPTVVNNVETLYNLPAIFREGPDWYKALSPGSDGGTKVYGASGWVAKPGLWELPLGSTAAEVLELAGGMAEGRTLRGFLPGGASTDFLPADKLDVKLDFDSVAAAGSRLGTGTLVVLDDRSCPVGMVLSLERFFARESCGWCSPCREGIPWIVKLLEAIESGSGTMDDIALLEELARKLAPGRTFCAFAPGAVEPLQSALKLFREDFEDHVKRGACRWRKDS
jgi:NADH-quinone oxidoreductase subunit F